MVFEGGCLRIYLTTASSSRSGSEKNELCVMRKEGQRFGSHIFQFFIQKNGVM